MGHKPSTFWDTPASEAFLGSLVTAMQKGAFFLRSNTSREQWTLKGPFLKGLPVEYLVALNPESAFEFGKIRTRRTFLPHQYVFLTSFAPPLACRIVAAPSYLPAEAARAKVGGASSHHPNGNSHVRTAKEPISRRKIASLVGAHSPHGVL